MEVVTMKNHGLFCVQFRTLFSVHFLLNLGLLLGIAHNASGRKGLTTYQDGSYKIAFNNGMWIQNASTFIRCGGKTYSTSDGSLSIVGNAEQGKVEDKLGEASTISYTYKAQSAGMLQTTIRQYVGRGITIFTQSFLSEFSGTKQASKDSVLSGFPSFKIEGPSDGNLGVLEYAGLFTRESMVLAKWKKGMNLVDGLTYGPLLFFDENNSVVLISTFNNFMAASMQYNKNDSTISYGIMGMVDSVPKGYSMDTIVLTSTEGINKAVAEWGRIMRFWYGKEINPASDDFTIKYLGYYTDNGAYYYHHTEPGMNYEDTMLGYYNYSRKMGIPYRYIQYDDWFYYITGKGYGATVTWDAMPSIFPHGLRWLYNATQLPVIAHNRYWSNITTYAKQNGGKFNFHMDGSMSLPLDQEFWDYLFATSVPWGMLVYEQDWLNFQTEAIDILYSDLYAGERWLKQMGEAASRWNLKLQYCMALPRHALQSLDIRTVTQIRASIDYQIEYDQWKIGISSMFADAMGIAPFKDNFWTTTNQPFNPYKTTEPYPELETVVAVLSTGPVGVSDRIGLTNTTIVSTTHAKDGLLLKPSRPAMAIDYQIKQTAFGLYKPPNKPGEVWSTYSTVSNFKFGIIFAAGVNKSLPITPQMAGFEDEPSWIVKRNKLSPFNQGASKPQPFSQSDTVDVGGCTLDNFCLFYTSPAFKLKNKEVLLFGEASKVVPMSAQRIQDMSVSSTDIRLTVQGSPEEVVVITVVINGKWVDIPCTVNSAGKAVVSVADMKCY